MTLQTALLLCGVALLVLIAGFSLERHKLQRIYERARAMREPELDAAHDDAPELSARIPVQDDQIKTISPNGPVDSGTRRATDLAQGGAGAHESALEAAVPELSELAPVSPDPVLARDDSNDAVTAANELSVDADSASEVGIDMTDTVTAKGRLKVDVDDGPVTPSLTPDTPSADQRLIAPRRDPVAISDELPDAAPEHSEFVMDTRSANVPVDAAGAVREAADGKKRRGQRDWGTRGMREPVLNPSGQGVSDTAVDVPIAGDEAADDVMTDMEIEIANLEQVTQKRVGPVFRIDEIDNDREVDFIAHLLDFDAPPLRDDILRVYRPVEYLLEKPHRIFGLSSPTQTWVNLEEEPETGRYTEVVLTLQLTDQQGPLTDAQLNKFSDLIVQICEATGGRFQFSLPFDAAKERAAKLDEFCKRFDVLAVLNVITPPERGFDGPAIAEFAKDYDMNLGRMKIFHRDNDSPDGGPHLFSLANLYKPGTFDAKDLPNFSTSGLTLFMNVPSTHEPGRVFREMAHVGRSLRERFNAELVDQNREPLTDDGIQKIQSEVDRLAAQMQKQGIAAGSESAVRLF